jgi:hypothetical protein
MSPADDDLTVAGAHSLLVRHTRGSSRRVRGAAAPASARTEEGGRRASAGAAAAKTTTTAAANSVGRWHGGRGAATAVGIAQAVGPGDSTRSHNASTPTDTCCRPALTAAAAFSLRVAVCSICPVERASAAATSATSRRHDNRAATAAAATGDHFAAALAHD